MEGFSNRLMRSLKEITGGDFHFVEEITTIRSLVWLGVWFGEPSNAEQCAGSSDTKAQIPERARGAPLNVCAEEDVREKLAEFPDERGETSHSECQDIQPNWLLSGQTFMNSIWLASNVSPILLANVFIDLNGGAATIQRIASSALRAGDPIVLACHRAVVVGLKTCALEALESLAPVVESPPGLGERHAPNSRHARESASLALDVHDASRLCP
jgi:hypothetical protein